MRINQNIAAMNAYRNLNNTQTQLNSSLEKLSSGFRINRAADDASGLVNSENLRSQIGGLKIATRNAQDAISLVQTAEGAQTEVHSLLQRMRDLVVQSGNLGTNDSVALQATQDEITQVREELNRIADQTQFGTLKIFEAFSGEERAAITTLVGLGITEDDTASDGTDPAAAEVTFGAFDHAANAGRTVAYTFTSTGSDADTYEVEAALGSTAQETAFNLQQALADLQVGGGGVTASLVGNVLTVAADDLDTNNDTFALTAVNVAADVEGGAVFQVGANADQNEVVRISNVDVDTLGVGGIDVTTADIDDVDSYIVVIDEAIATVSASRAELGAFQNRMESTIRNLSVAVENLSAAESRIRDTDMALEMVEFTRSQILSQAGTAMLAQANTIPQSVLALLQ